VSIQQVLERVARLIEKGWTFRGPARSQDGRRVEARSIEAVEWSLFGALAAVERPFSPLWEDAVARLVRESGEHGPVHLMEWSESKGRTRKDVEALLTRTMSHES
jgi:hypothetical protein